MSADKRAEFAYASTTEAIQVLTPVDETKEYKSYCKKLPMMIKTNGLGATLAFIRGKANSKSKGNKAYGQIETIFHEWLKKDEPGKLVFPMDRAPKDLAEHIVEMDSENYRAASVEILALLNWMRRFADGLIVGESEE